MTTPDDQRAIRVAIFASAYYPHTGGVEELVRQLCHEFAHQRVEPIILTDRWPRSLPREEVYEGTPVHRLSMRLPEWNWRVRLVHALTFPATRRRMLDILRRHRSEVIHVQCVGANGLYALAAQQALGLPLVLSVQGERTMDANEIYTRLPSLNHTLRALVGAASAITGCSRDTLADLEQWWGGPLGSHARVMHNGIRPGDFASGLAQRHPRPYILGIGRVVAQKGFDVLIDAFAEANLPGHDLFIVGDGPEKSALMQRAQERGLGDRVHFPGRADRVQAVAYFKGCAFFCLPSRMEPFGIVNLEAMAAGKAVVASRTGGVPEVVLDGETGLLVPPGDVHALAAALRRFAHDQALCDRLGAAGLRRIEDFTWPAIAQAYRQIYLDALAGRRARTAGGPPAPSHASLAGRQQFAAATAGET
jgi:glycosyltransferase involved in cell wall biosynthesis